MSGIQIRAVVAADLPQLMSMDHSSSSEYVWQLELRRDARAAQIVATLREVRLPRPVVLAYPNDPFSLAETWTSKAMLLAATFAEDVVGYLALSERPRSVAWVTDVVVAPRWRRQGAAGRMLAAAQASARERGHRKLFLEMQSKNHPAIRFAQKHGYEFCGYNDHYYVKQDIALFFTRGL